MLRTSTPYTIVTTQTTAPRTTGKESVRTSTPDQTTTMETTAARTTPKKLVRTSTPDQTTTTERAARSPKRRAEQDRTERNPCESEPPVERRPVDVTTMRTTPQRTPTTAPSLDVAKLNGGVSWIPAEWRHRSDPVIPESMVERITSRRSTLHTLPALREEALARPRAQRMCRGVHTEASADRSEMGQIDRSRRRRGCAGALRHKICTASLDNRPLIDGFVFLLDSVLVRPK